jgi:hypothetical protein
LLELEDEVAGLEGPSVYPSAVVITEALLVNCRAYEGDIPGFIQQVLCVRLRLFGVFFDVGHHAGRAIALVRR